jgi:hypothetical protein
VSGKLHVPADLPRPLDRTQKRLLSVGDTVSIFAHVYYVTLSFQNPSSKTVTIKSPSRSIRYNSGSVECLTMGTVTRDGSCRFFPLNFQLAFRCINEDTFYER